MVIKENGIIYCPFFIGGANGTFFSCRRLSYSSVIWHEGFKFVFGSTYGEYIDQIAEVSTGAKCVGIDEITPSSVNIEQLLYQKFLSKIKQSGLSVGDLVERFNNEANVNIKTWQVSLLIG